MSDFHFNGGDIVAASFAASVVLVDQLCSLPMQINPRMPVDWSALIDVSIKAAVGALVGLFVKFVWESATTWVKNKINKPSK